ncbi:unnamed protein product [Kuraishia capsulata CBS 1993]|uniref:Uncharacterized protein n=1 Tax=Kuraishia capsulata CBS 1993 TaxID=1382522 RepID=W6MWB8_9ASCO|nr:uncharacterized protein KUCA_T00003147001 [Kuraishia capsulata CBS 1993]CDK27170.1 unnamed protein product [Kuraishia capsulata CBS 1993]
MRKLDPYNRITQRLKLIFDSDPLLFPFSSSTKETLKFQNCTQWTPQQQTLPPPVAAQVPFASADLAVNALLATPLNYKRYSFCLVFAFLSFSAQNSRF